MSGLVSLAVAFIVILANGIASGAYRSISLASIGLLTWPADWQAGSTHRHSLHLAKSEDELDHIHVPYHGC